MKVRFIFKSFLPKVFGATAITLYPFIFFTDDEALSIKKRVVYHEMVHVQQVRKLGWFRMYGSYVIDYFELRFAGHGHWEAYSLLPLELEAYKRSKDRDLEDAYLKERAR